MIDRLEATLTADAGNNLDFSSQANFLYFVCHDPCDFNPLVRPKTHDFPGVAVVDQAFHTRHTCKIPGVGTQSILVNREVVAEGAECGAKTPFHG